MRCPHCGSVLEDCESAHHGCMEDHGTIAYGRSLCPRCGEGCYSWKSETSPGFKGETRSKCCRCDQS